MSSLFSQEELDQMHERYEREHPIPETKAEALCRVARANCDATVAELAEAAERSSSWVRRILKQAGITPAKALRLPRSAVAKPRAKHANLSTPCARPGCAHSKSDHCWTQGKRRHGAGQFAHHFSLRDGTESGWYQCVSNHCLTAPYNGETGKIEPCMCPEYVDPFAKPVTRPRNRISNPTIKRMLALAQLEPQEQEENQ
jgi:hypothetical protein